MSQGDDNNNFFTNIESKNMNLSKKPDNIKKTSFVNKTNKFPILIEKGDNNYKYSSKEQYFDEENKEDKKPKMLNKLNNKLKEEMNKEE